MNLVLVPPPPPPDDDVGCALDVREKVPKKKSEREWTGRKNKDKEEISKKKKKIFPCEK